VLDGRLSLHGGRFFERQAILSSQLITSRVPSSEFSQAPVRLSSDIRGEMKVLECKIKGQIQKEERDQAVLEL
jgi:hypothetical protein